MCMAVSLTFLSSTHTLFYILYIDKTCLLIYYFPFHLKHNFIISSRAVEGINKLIDLYKFLNSHIRVDYIYIYFILIYFLHHILFKGN